MLIWDMEKIEQGDYPARLMLEILSCVGIRPGSRNGKRIADVELTEKHQRAILFGFAWSDGRRSWYKTNRHDTEVHK